MSRFPREDDPILRAINELRSELDRLIESEVRRWRVSGSEPRPPERLKPETGPAPQASAPAAGAGEDSSRKLDAIARRLEDRLRARAGPGVKGQDA